MISIKNEETIHIKVFMICCLILKKSNYYFRDLNKSKLFKLNYSTIN